MSTGYRRAARHCRSVNRVNALHIALENRMTPPELVALHAAQGRWFGLRMWLQRAWRLLPAAWRRADAGTAPEALRDEWLRKLHRFYTQAVKPTPEPFRRRKLSRHLRLYSAGGPRHDKTLLMCFVGGSNRPFLPLPVFLQHLDAALSHFDFGLAVGVPPYAVRATGGVDADVFDIAEVVETKERVSFAKAGFFDAAPGELWSGVAKETVIDKGGAHI